MKIFGKIVPILILSLLSSPLLLQSCGDKAPFGTSVTVEEFGSTIYTQSDPLDATTAIKTQYYRVTVMDEDGFPMNGIKVDVFGTIGTNSVIDNFGSATPPGTAFNDKTGNFGFFDFAVVAHTYSFGGLLDPTTAPTVTYTSGAGALTVVAGDSEIYCYQYAAIDSLPAPAGPGETVESPVGCVSVDNSLGATDLDVTVTVTWPAIFGANGYRVYGRILGSIALIGSTVAGDLSFDDPGSTPSGSLPGTNSTGQSNNSISGTLTVTSGANVGTLTISF